MNVPLWRGMVIRHQNHVFIIEDLSERHTGQQKPTLHVKLRDLLDGRHIDRTLDEVMPIQEVEHSSRELQYLYHRPGKDGDAYVFMDDTTLDEFELSTPQLAGFEPFLNEGQEFRVMFVDGQPARLELPDIIALHVTETAAPEHSIGAANSILKEARLENGLTVHVPMFIKRGDLIRVDTRARTYAGKEKEHV
jgi:elongation factor P